MSDMSAVDLFNTIRKEARVAIKSSADEEQARIQELYDRVDSTVKNWSEPVKCSYPDCRSTSIRNSHTVQSAALKNGLGSELRGPTWDSKSSKLTVGKISARSSSVFPGYCKQHEAMFHFEKSVHLKNVQDDALQAMRTLHREAWLISSRSSLANSLQALASQILKVDSAQDFLSSDDKERIESVKKWCADFCMAQDSMRVRIMPTIERLEALGTDESQAKRPAWLFAADMDKQPFALLATVMLDGLELAPLISLTLLPNQQKSRVIATVEADFDCILPKYVESNFSEKVFSNTMLKFLKDGTLDWYASASWWNSLTAGERSEIEASL